MKKLLFALLYRTGTVRVAAWWNRKRLMILCYHGVTGRAERSPSDHHGLHVRVDRFRNHLRHLQRHYRVISLREFVNASRAKQSLPLYSVILTFDDGYRNFLTAAAPSLADKNFSAAIFLITDRVRDDQTTSSSGEWVSGDDETFLSWAEVRYLIEDGGFEFGSHTCSHRKLATPPAEECRQEMLNSQAAIASRLELSDFALAYPYGDYSAVVAEQARAMGYSCALTTDDGANDGAANVFTLRRTLVGDDDDEAAFAVRVSGAISWISRRRRSGK